MRRAGRRSWLFGALALLGLAALIGCQNPLNPLDKSDRIEGLTFIDFSATWDRWDSDPQFDGIVVTIDYFNEFGDSLSFHDKPHNVVIEFWTQEDSGDEGEPFLTKDELIFSRTIEFSDSDDEIRIPIEAYEQQLRRFDFSDPVTGLDPAEITGFMVVRVFPPDGFPREELFLGQPDILFFKEEEAEDAPNP